MITEIKGLLGFWKFPFINKIIAKRKPKYSIKDHTIIYGNPNYIDNYKIRVDKNSTPWTIEFKYETTINVTTFKDDVYSRTDKEIYATGQRLVIDQSMLDYPIKERNMAWIFEQVSPR